MNAVQQRPISPGPRPWYLNYRIVFAPLVVLLALVMVPGSIGHLAMKGVQYYAPMAFFEVAALIRHAQAQKDRKVEGG